VLAALAERGHVVVSMPAGSLEFGAAQVISPLEAGYAAGSEPRRDGQAAGF
jgi:gamma-glutamyltranspeptidase / glutathione hydrolase